MGQEGLGRKMIGPLALIGQLNLPEPLIHRSFRIGAEPVQSGISKLVQLLFRPLPSVVGPQHRTDRVNAPTTLLVNFRLLLPLDPGHDDRFA